MKNITSLLNEIYVPKKALLIHKSLTDEYKFFVEAYDINENGNPINAHPLSVAEMSALADCFNACADLNNDFLVPKSILPDKILYTNPLRLGYAIWYTAPQKVHLLFKKQLGILSGDAWVPAMVWKANKDELAVYAIQTKGKPDADTPLFHAPSLIFIKPGKSVWERWISKLIRIAVWKILSSNGKAISGTAISVIYWITFHL